MNRFLTFPPIETILDSVGKIRILNLLATVDELNITAIANNTGLNHVRLKQHLSELQDMHIIQEKKFGRIRIYTINQQSEPAMRLKKFLKIWKLETGVQVD